MVQALGRVRARTLVVAIDSDRLFPPELVREVADLYDLTEERLTQLERDKLVEEYREVLKTIEYLRSVLGSEALVRKIIRDELTEIKEKYKDERRTKIVKEEAELTLEDLNAEEEVVVTIDRVGAEHRRPLRPRPGAQRFGKDDRHRSHQPQLPVHP